jgi:hypothetical protein
VHEVVRVTALVVVLGCYAGISVSIVCNILCHHTLPTTETEVLLVVTELAKSGDSGAFD